MCFVHYTTPPIHDTKSGYAWPAVTVRYGHTRPEDGSTPTVAQAVSGQEDKQQEEGEETGLLLPACIQVRPKLTVWSPMPQKSRVAERLRRPRTLILTPTEPQHLVLQPPRPPATRDRGGQQAATALLPP